MGSTAFGSLLIAVAEFIHSIVVYLQRHSAGSQNCLAKCVFGMINCCLCCIESCLQIINDSAYVQIAITSRSFCFAGKDAVELLISNAFRLGVLDVMAVFVCIMGRWLVTLLVTAGCYLIMTNYYQESVQSLVSAMVLTAFVSYAIAGVFFSSFKAIARTMIQCYITGACCCS